MNKVKAFLALKLLQSLAKGKDVQEHYLHACVINGKASVDYQKVSDKTGNWHGFRLLRSGKFEEAR